MNIDAVDFFYLSMPEVTTEADGSQDALLVRVAAGGLVGYGECEAAPLPSIAAFRLSDVARRPAGRSPSVLGHRLDEDPTISRRSRPRSPTSSMDLLQAHPGPASRWRCGTSSARPAASRSGPCSAIAGTSRRRRMRRCCSARRLQLRPSNWGRAARTKGFRAIKYGWGPIGRGSVATPMPNTSPRHARPSAPTASCSSTSARSSARTSSGPRRACRLRGGRRGLVGGALPCQRAGGLCGACAAQRQGPGWRAARTSSILDGAPSDRLRPDRVRADRLRPDRRHRAGRPVADHAVARGVTYVNHAFTSTSRCRRRCSRMRDSRTIGSANTRRRRKRWRSN